MELPSNKIEVKLHLTEPVRTVLRDLRPFLEDYGMDVSQDHHGDHDIIVTGSPPEAGFDAANILAIVRKYDRAARIIESSNQSAFENL